MTFDRTAPQILSFSDAPEDPIDTCDDCGNRLEEGEVGLCQCCEEDRDEPEPQVEMF
jgi:hypothetical protein